jgi:predicted dehydrogenase
VATGTENRLNLRIHGEAGGLFWAQESPNELVFTPLNGVEQRITRSGAGAGPVANAASRIPAGHPEGYLEAFATLYREAAEDILSDGSDGRNACQGLQEALDGMRFIDACLKSSAHDAGWCDL